MGFSVNTNASALAALQTLNSTTRSLNQAQARINTGFRVNGAKDNASTFAIAQGMRGDIAGLKSVQESVSLGQATVGVALSAAQQISDKLSEMKQKVTQGQAANVDRGAIQNDINAIIDTIDNICAAAQFNGVNLLNNSSPSGLNVVSSLNRTSATAVSVAVINVQAEDLTSATIGVSSINLTSGVSSTFSQSAGLSFAEGDTVTIAFDNSAGNQIDFVFELNDGTGAALNTATTTTPSGAAGTIAVAVVSDTATDTPAQTLGKLFTAMRSVGLTVVNNEDGSFTVTSSGQMQTATQSIAAGGLTAGAVGTNPAVAMTTVETAINNVKNALARLGTSANQLETQADFVKSLTDTLTTGVSTLVDADLAEESATLQALQTKQQLGIQALSIANQQSGAVLSLFRGG
jgi:flagellin